MNFKQGVKDGIPIFLGYLSVSFAFGVLSIEKGFPLWFPVLTSILNFTGTGQFVGVDLIAAGASLAELALTMLIVNIRYALMSVSLTQKLSPSIGIGGRMWIAFGNTDEIFAVSVRKKEALPLSYMTGIIICSYTGWVGGTAIGALAGNLFPPALLSAFGISLHAMFIAIIIPPVKEDKRMLAAVVLSVLLSCLFYFIPFLSAIGTGWAVIICSVAAAFAAAMVFPIKTPEELENENL